MIEHNSFRVAPLRADGPLNYSNESDSYEDIILRLTEVSDARQESGK